MHVHKECFSFPVINWFAYCVIHTFISYLYVYYQQLVMSIRIRCDASQFVKSIIIHPLFYELGDLLGHGKILVNEYKNFFELTERRWLEYISLAIFKRNHANIYLFLWVKSLERR